MSEGGGIFRRYLEEIESIEREAVEAVKNAVQWAKLKLAEARIRYEREKGGLKPGELYEP